MLETILLVMVVVGFPYLFLCMIRNEMALRFSMRNITKCSSAAHELIELGCKEFLKPYSMRDNFRSGYNSWGSFMWLRIGDWSYESWYGPLDKEIDDFVRQHMGQSK